MNKHRLLAILLTLGCMINLTGCSRDIVKAASGANVQERTVEAENVNKGKKSDGENDRISQEERADIISEDDTLEKIVDPAYEEVERYLDEESAYKGFQGVALVAQGNEIKFAKAYGNADYDDNIVNKEIAKLVAKQKEECPEEAYDSVRGVFFEGSELYPTSGFREKDHIQISIINPNCIKAFFKLRKEDKKYKLV